jgi:predicted nucleic acid-binding protein
MLFFRPDVGIPVDATGRPVDHVKERIALLIRTLEKAKTKIIVPTPALSEILVRAGATAAAKIVEEIHRLSVFRVEAFDTRAAIEVAAMTRSALEGGKKKRDSAATYAKLKYDRQIVAIAKVTQSATIYSDDRGIKAIAKRSGIRVIGLADLPLPSEDAQKDLFAFKNEDVNDSAPETAIEAGPPAQEGPDGAVS